MRNLEFTHTITISPKSGHGYDDLDQEHVDIFMSKLSGIIGLSFFDGNIQTTALLAQPWKKIRPSLGEVKEFDVLVPLEKDNDEIFRQIYIIFSKSTLAAVAFMAISKKQSVSSASDGFFLTPY